MKRDPEVTKCLAKITSAHRRTVRAVEQYAAADDRVGTLPGHRAEMRRRLLRFSDELAHALQTLERT